MSCQKRSGESYDVSNPAPKELRDLAGLALRKRELLRELEIVEHKCRQLEREIELKGIEVPWLTNHEWLKL